MNERSTVDTTSGAVAPVDHPVAVRRFATGTGPVAPYDDDGEPDDLEIPSEEGGELPSVFDRFDTPDEVEEYTTVEEEPLGSHPDDERPAPDSVLAALPGAPLIGLENRFDRALEHLQYAFQPVVCAVTGHLFGFAAEVRSAEPSLEDGVRLVNAAERLGRIAALGRRHRRLVAERFAPHAERGRMLLIALHPHDVSRAVGELTSRFMPLSRIAQRVIFELRAHPGLSEVRTLRDDLLELRQRGYRIAVESSALTTGSDGIPIADGDGHGLSLGDCDLVLLGATTTHTVDRGPAQRSTVADFVAACRAAGVPVVARGVASHGEWRTLAEMGCAFVQGDYVAPWAAEPIEPTTHARLSTQTFVGG
jgi:EAL domain-containing protein (putative c-di-GMP-specific phosphodiesterase class I)